MSNQNDEFERAVEEQKRRILREGRIHRKGERDARKRFESTLQRSLKQPLELFETIYLAIRGAGQACVNLYGSRAKEQEDYLFLVYATLCARASRVTAEVQVLLETGHVTGALTRWRTLYELMVVSAFVNKHGATVAERYHYHDYIQVRDLLEQQYAANIAQGDPVPPDLARLREHATTLCAKYGEAFANNYGWAVGFVSRNKKTGKDNLKPTFTHIEEQVSIEGIEKLEGWYKVASNSVHATTIANTFHIEYFDNHTLPIESNSINLIVPAWLSLTALLACTAYLVQHYDPGVTVPFLQANDRLIRDMMRSIPRNSETS